MRGQGDEHGRSRGGAPGVERSAEAERRRRDLDQLHGARADDVQSAVRGSRVDHDHLGGAVAQILRQQHVQDLADGLCLVLCANDHGDSGCNDP